MELTRRLERGCLGLEGGYALENVNHQMRKKKIRQKYKECVEIEVTGGEISSGCYDRKM
jgi:hypothetical protein